MVYNDTTMHSTMTKVGVVSKKWPLFSFRFGLPKDLGFRFGFGFTKLTAVSVFGSVFCNVLLNVYDARNDVLPCWIGPINCQPKWLRTKNAEIGMKKNTVTVDPIMLQDELWMKQLEKPSPNRGSLFFEIRTAETEFSVFEFWGRLGSVWFLENQYPKFSSDSAHP